jgi:phenol 2-monooxygenase
VIDVRAVIQDDYRDVAFERMPDLLKPAKGRYGLKDYEKVFCADRRGGRDIFALRGIDRSSGCVVVIRPDQYIAHILPLSAQDELEAFFGGFMIEVRRPNMEETEVSTVETLSS